MDNSFGGTDEIPEDFSRILKRLPEDCIEYTLFIDLQENSQAQVRSNLQCVQRAAAGLQRRLLKEHIWQRDGFTLEYCRENGSSFLRGRTNFGDSIEDEWLVVYLLRELSKEFSSLLIRITDSDGEFLLIEAANALPHWLNPEVADNRVWLRNGNIYIIPLEKSSQTKERSFSVPAPLALEDALSIVRNGTDGLYHSTSLQEEAFYRLRNYPEQIALNLHHARVLVPRELAYILHEDPALISSAVEAFYLRDPISLRPFQTEDDTGLIFRPRDLVTVSAKFTKVGYAQIKSQHFPAPAAWSKVLSENGTDDSRLESSAEVGMKISCGFEMMLRGPHSQNKRSVQETKLLLEDLEAEDGVLPSDKEISTWEKKEDDAGWLDIDFQDFEEVLAGKGASTTDGAPAPSKSSGPGFGDKVAQENLRKLVERFENFLNDDKAGAEGAELPEDMDFDDEDKESDDEGSEEDSEGEDKELSFNEEEFSRMMREMMGMPTEETSASGNGNPAQAEKLRPTTSDDHFYATEKVDDTSQIQEIMDSMEAELKEAGALELDPATESNDARRKLTHKKQRKGVEFADHGKRLSTKEEEDLREGESSEEEEGVHIDYNLAKNLLESFKGQAGFAGPGGNIMGLMGVQLPRDDGENQSSHERRAT